MNMSTSHGYMERVFELIENVERAQLGNIKRAARLMADAVKADKLIHVYGGGGHTTLCMGEMFFRAGGLANINPLMETGLSVFNQSLKYLELERTVNFGSSIVKYYRLNPGDVAIIYHNIGVNAATIDAAEEIKRAGARLIAVSSSYWQNGLDKEHPIRHPNGKNLFDYADVCIDDLNPVGDAVVELDGLDTPIAPVSNIVDFYIAHRLEIETVSACLEMGVRPPVWKSANLPGGDEYNRALVEKYLPRVKNL